MSANLINRFSDQLICPLCQSGISVEGLKLVCNNNHSYDIAKQGYVNLLNQKNITKYNQDLFTARNDVIMNSSFFDQLHKKLTEMIKKYNFFNSLSILDAGSGEGSHLIKLHKKILRAENLVETLVGIDISKEGILTAAKHSQDQSWFVADLANIPFKAQTFDILLNILSPANYEEFNRVLKPESRIIKVVPQVNYLKEIRESAQNQNNDYSNEKIVKLFSQHFHGIIKERLEYEIVLEKRQIESLLHMTPLAWGWSEEEIKIFSRSAPKSITVDFDILSGIKK